MAPSAKINLWTGLECHPIEIKETETLEDIRKRVTPSIISEDNSNKSIWRFVYQVIEVNPQVLTIPFDDAVFGRSMEKMMKALSFVEGRNTLYMADINRATPDLFGLKTAKYLDRDLEVSIFNNSSVTPGKLAPVMLERVRALKKQSLAYNNVLVCEDGTAISIQVHAKGHGAMGFSLRSDAGDNIVESLYNNSSDPDKDAWSAIRRYEKTDAAITVNAIKGTEISDKEWYKHSHLTLDVWKLYKFTDSAGNRHDFSKRRSYPMAAPPKETGGYVLPGDSVENGKAGEGKKTGVAFGTIYDIEENRNDKIGTINLELFVFKSMEAAYKVFEINATIPTYS